MKTKPNKFFVVLFYLNPAVLVGVYMALIAAPVALVSWGYQAAGLPAGGKGFTLFITLFLAIFGVFRIYSAYQEYKWRDDDKLTDDEQE